MTTPDSRTVRGLSVLEALAALAITALIVLAMGRSLASAQGVTDDSRQLMTARAENRRCLDAIANQVRGAAVQSLGGFDASGATSSLVFQVPSGTTPYGATLGPAETLAWRLSPVRSQAAAGLGEVIATSDTTLRVLAPRVPRGGFTVVQQGTALRIRLTTSYASARGGRRTLSGEACASLRN